MAELIVWEPDGSVRRRSIGEEGLALGRCRIAKGSGGVYTIEDPSRHTRVNGRPVVDVVAIRSGDVIVHDSVTAQLVVEDGVMSLDITLDEGIEDAGEQT